MNDKDLLRQLKSGNSESYRYLIDTYRNLVWNISLRMTGNRDVSEDLFQEVFLRIYKDISKFRGESKLSTWIGAISYNVCTDYLRKKKRREVFDERDLSELSLDIKSDWNTGSEVHSNEMKELVRTIINNLPISYKILINLYHIEEFSYNEIAEITGKPVGTIKSYLNRGRALIKNEILKIIPNFKEIHFEAFV